MRCAFETKRERLSILRKELTRCKKAGDKQGALDALHAQSAARAWFMINGRIADAEALLAHAREMRRDAIKA